MKAKIIATGEIINIAEYAKVTLDRCNSFGDPITLPFDEVEVINEPTIEELESRHAIPLKQSDMPSEERMMYELTKAAIPTAYKMVADSGRTDFDGYAVALCARHISNEILKQLKEREVTK